ncbi:MAG: dTMP kinase [Magnetococcales bacterium]|nr:dTMP kinase [Magnetococcales bacterium]
MVKRGQFITFEGGEGSGKTTQIALLADYLKNRGIMSCITREPGGTPFAEKIRALVVTGTPDSMSHETELLLITAARMEHLYRTIQPALERGEWVLCDRFSDSTLAYQGYGRGIGLEKIKALMAWASIPKPDLTILLTIDPHRGLSRAEERLTETARTGEESESRFEHEEVAFHERVQKGFESLAVNEPDRINVVDADRTIQEIHATIRQIMETRI